jgi:type III pantothenate kinase
MMNLVVDYGNSSAKVGIFDNHLLKEKFIFKSADELKSFLQLSKEENVIISSVSHDAEEVSKWAVNAKQRFVLHHSLPLPIAVGYATPHTLGVDRIAGVCGAHQMFPGNHSLVIDAGTCITYDFIDSKGRFEGGGISPGLSMRFQAVHTFTKRLPLIDRPESANVSLIGDSTETCIKSGVVNGVIAELDGIILQYSEKFERLRVILCGGDVHFFENSLKASIFAVPELVLSGLNSILIYNVNR